MSSIEKEDCAKFNNDPATPATASGPTASNEEHMTSGKLQGVRVAILASDGFKEFELIDIRHNLDQAGGATFVVGTTKDKVKGLNPAG